MTDRPPRGLAIPVSCPCGASVLVRFGTGRDQLYRCDNCDRRISIRHEVVATDQIRYEVQGEGEPT